MIAPEVASMPRRSHEDRSGSAKRPEAGVAIV